jgi:hypothetical protein
MDGLYIKRYSNGKVKDFMVVESKTGNSTLNYTSSGQQMSQQWIQHNIEILKRQTLDRLREAQKNGDRVEIEKCTSLLNDLEQIQQKANAGMGRKVVVRTTIEMKSGQPYLKITFYTIVDVSDGEVNLKQRLAKDGTPDTKEIPLNTRDDKNLTKYERSVKNEYFNSLRNKLIELNVPPELADLVVNNLKRDIKNGNIKLADKNLEAAIVSYLIDSLRANSRNSPEINKACADLERNALIGLPHAMSHAKAGVVGGLTSGLLSAMMEYWSTGRVSWESGREAIIGGGIDVVSSLGERGWAVGFSRLANTGLVDDLFGPGAAEFLRTSNFGRIGGGVMIVITSVAIPGYDYLQGNISGSEFAIRSAGGIGIGVASWYAGAQIGAIVGTILPGVGTAIGIVSGALIGLGLDYALNIFLASDREREQREMAIEDAILQDQKKVEDNKIILENMLEMSEYYREKAISLLNKYSFNL